MHIARSAVVMMACMRWAVIMIRMRRLGPVVAALPFRAVAGVRMAGMPVRRVVVAVRRVSIALMTGLLRIQ